MKSVAFLGNCQADAVRQAYAKFVAPHNEEVTHYVPTYKDSSNHERNIIRNADVIVELVYEASEINDLDAICPRATRYRFPFVAAGWLWPHHGTPHPRSEIKRFRHAEMVDCSDAFLNKMILSGVTPADAASRYLALKAGDFRGLDRRYEMMLEQQRARDLITGFKSTELIEAHFRNEQTFSTLFHPTLRLAKYVVLTLFENMGVSPQDRERTARFMKQSFYPSMEVPIHPVIAEHFGLRYLNKDHRWSWLSVGPITFKEYATRYMTWDVNDELEEGLERLNHGEMEIAIGLLHRGLKLSPESTAGTIGLIQGLLKMNEIAQAAQVADRTSDQSLQDAVLSAVSGVAFARVNRHEDAIRNYEISLVADPANVQTYMDLSWSLWKLKRHMEAVDVLKTALELAPNQSDINERLDAILIDKDQMIEKKNKFSGHIQFGRQGNAAQYQRDGWSGPEADGTWAVGRNSSIVISRHASENGIGIEIDVAPFICLPILLKQSIELIVNGVSVGIASVVERTVLGFDVPPSIIGLEDLVLEFRHADFAIPQNLNTNLLDDRPLSLYFRYLRLVDVPANYFGPTGGVSGLKFRVRDVASEGAVVAASEFLSRMPVSDLVSTFESVGVDCEFGLVQRHLGAEPLGLLRFSTVHLRPLLNGLNDGFCRLGERESIDFTLDPSGEYIVNEKCYQLRYHTFVYEKEASAEQMRDREVKKLTFLRRKFLEQVQEGNKIFVYKSFQRVGLAEILPLFFALNRYGNNILLWMTLTNDESLQGTVKELRPGLLLGHMNKFSRPVVGETDRDVRCWLEVCVNALALAPQFNQENNVKISVGSSDGSSSVASS